MKQSANEIKADKDRIRRHVGKRFSTNDPVWRDFDEPAPAKPSAHAPLTAREFLKTWTCNSNLPWDSTDFMLEFAEDFASYAADSIVAARGRKD